MAEKDDAVKHRLVVNHGFNIGNMQKLDDPVKRGVIDIDEVYDMLVKKTCCHRDSQLKVNK